MLRIVFFKCFGYVCQLENQFFMSSVMNFGEVGLLCVEVDCVRLWSPFIFCGENFSLINISVVYWMWLKIFHFLKL